MPIYEYECQQCNQQFEYMQAVSDDPKTECEQCGGELRKLISPTSFQLKGDGWYKDLYSSKKPETGGEAAPAKADGGASSEAASTPAGGKSESKAAPKKGGSE